MQVASQEQRQRSSAVEAVDIRWIRLLQWRVSEKALAETGLVH